MKNAVVPDTYNQDTDTYGVNILTEDTMYKIEGLPATELLIIEQDLEDIVRSIASDDIKPLVRKYKYHLQEGGIEELSDFLSDTLYAIKNLEGDITSSENYASIGIAIEKRRGPYSRKVYDTAVQAAREIGVPLTKAIKIGSMIAVIGNTEKAGRIIGETAGLNNHSNHIFGQIYNLAVERHGIENATRLFVPSYFYTIKMMENPPIDKTKFLIDMADHVDPVVETLENDKEYKKDLVITTEQALRAVVHKLSRNPRESWQYAAAYLGVHKAKYNTDRWKETVQQLTKRKLSLRSALKIGTELEKYSKNNNGSYRIDPVLRSLTLQDGTGISEDDAVDNSIKALYRDRETTQDTVIGLNVGL